MKKILVPVDFSECSDIALEQAVFLAGELDSEIHLYHVAALHPYWRDLSVSDKEAYKANRDLAEIIERNLDQREKGIADRGIKVISGYSHGQIIEMVAKYAEEFEIDLMVIGTHGMSGYREWMIGSNTQKILRNVSCPVLAVKHRPLEWGFKEMAFVSNFHEGSMPAFEQVLDFASRFNAGIYLVNMDEPGFFGDPVLVIRQAMREYQDIAKSRGLECHIVRITDGDLEEGLQREIKEHHIDLVVIPTYSRGPIARLFLSSIAEAVVNHMDTPIMTIRI